MGCGAEESARILRLLSDRPLLEYYVSAGKKYACEPLVRIGRDFPRILRIRLGEQCPACLWAKGNRDLLKMPGVALVGKRDLWDENRIFAREVGRQAAAQGFVLISGNARGADQEAQNACLQHGGNVISIVADSLTDKRADSHILYLSEDSYEEPFSSQRALSRNNCIHALARAVYVAQTGDHEGGTWSGTVRNLHQGWSPVAVYDDGSPGMACLADCGAVPVTLSDLRDLGAVQKAQTSFL